MSVWEGRPCWFVVFNSNGMHFYALIDESPHSVKKAEGARIYTDEQIVFTVELSEQEKELPLSFLRDLYKRGVRPGFELRQHLEYGGTPDGSP